MCVSLFEEIVRGDKQERINLYSTAIFAMPIFVVAFLQFSGLRLNNLAVFVSSAAFLTLLAASYFVTNSNVVRNDLAEAKLAASFTLGYVLFRLPSFVSGGQLSLFSAPTSSSGYLSVLGQAPPLVQLVTNGVLAPFVENLALLGIAPLVYLTVDQLAEGRGLDFLDSIAVKIGVSAVPVGVVFALLHGVRNLSFLVLPVGVMFLWVYVTATEELSSEIIPVVPLGIPFTIGAHMGHNLSVSGVSTVDFLSRMLSAPAEFQFAGYLIAGFMLLTFALTLVFVYKYGDELVAEVSG
jgi:hypothetical protein